MKAILATLVTSWLLATSAHAQAVPTHKGFAEIGLGWGYMMSTSPFLEVNNGTKLEPPHAAGLELDLGGGYQIVPGLFVIGDFQYAKATSIKGSGENGRTNQYWLSYNVLSAGLRTAVPAGSGEIYADFVLGMLLPFDLESEGTFQLGGGGGGTIHTTVGMNTGIGGRGDVGYHYAINEQMYVGAGLRLEAFSTDNVGQKRVRRDQNGQTETETYTTDPNAQGPSASAFSVQDLRLRLSFGYRF